MGSLQWCSGIRFDIAQATGVMAQFASNPMEEHIVPAKQILRYLHGTKNFVVTLGASGGLKDLIGYVDSNWGGCSITARSTTGYIFFKNGGVISHCSKRQPTVSTSSTQAEYTALSATGKEISWLRLLESEIDGVISDRPTTLRTDSLGAAALVKNPEFHSKTKHINIKYHHIRELVEDGEIRIEWIKGVDNLPDMLTKPLEKVLFYRALERARIGPLQEN